jgi:hypothetical protein
MFFGQVAVFLLVSWLVVLSVLVLLLWRFCRKEQGVKHDLKPFRSGLVRFNPFGDTGGNQSFALALLDSEGDGVVILSLHSREGTRIYVKPVKKGKAELKVSDEEERAIKIAQSQ